MSQGGEDSKNGQSDMEPGRSGQIETARDGGHGEWSRKRDQKDVAIELGPRKTDQRKVAKKKGAGRTILMEIYMSPLPLERTKILILCNTCQYAIIRTLLLCVFQ